MNAVPFAEFKKTKRTTQNPINKSGKSGEVLLEKTLISKFPDFLINSLPQNLEMRTFFF